MEGVQVSKTCPQCQGQASDEAAFCPNCGGPLAIGTTSDTSAQATSSPSVGGAPTAPARPTDAYAFNAARWSVADRISGVATLVLLISLFLPWFSLGGFFSISGLTAHGYLYLVLFLSIAVLLYLGARAGWDRLPLALPIAHAPVMLAASLVNVVLVVIAFVFKPGGSAVSWSVGALLALVASIVAAAPVAVPAIQARRGG